MKDNIMAKFWGRAGAGDEWEGTTLIVVLGLLPGALASWTGRVDGSLQRVDRYTINIRRQRTFGAASPQLISSGMKCHFLGPDYKGGLDKKTDCMNIQVQGIKGKEHGRCSDRKNVKFAERSSER
ncbi:hypothetical protein DFS33DRAFT_1026517 [Desarmillaria ectypa]|nr:hypothetical protein DFS33DRAFT_1026517 [Desarmillaria ectypa]